MTKEQAQWAMNHDWYVSMYHDVDVGYVVVGKTTTQADGEPLSRIHTADFQKLRDWAGY